MIEPHEPRLLAAGAALDDLAPEEFATWESHRATCGECRVLESELALVVADLSLVAPERMPPPGLFDAVRRSIRSAPGVTQDEAPEPVSLAAAREAREARGPRRAPVALLGLAAVLAIAVAGLGLRSVALQGDLDRADGQVAALEARLTGQGAVVAAVMDPAHVSVALHAEPLAPSAAAMVTYVPGTSRAYLVVVDLPATPSGHGYQLWFADAAGVHPLQTVPFDGIGAFIAPLDVDLSSAAAVMITLEEAGGATGEPGPQVIFGEI